METQIIALVTASSRGLGKDMAMKLGAAVLGHRGDADDVGGLVAFQCSEDARGVNGPRIELSGGMNV